MASRWGPSCGFPSSYRLLIRCCGKCYGFSGGTSCEFLQHPSYCMQINSCLSTMWDIWWFVYIFEGVAVRSFYHINQCIFPPGFRTLMHPSCFFSNKYWKPHNCVFLVLILADIIMALFMGILKDGPHDRGETLIHSLQTEISLCLSTLAALTSGRLQQPSPPAQWFPTSNHMTRPRMH